MSAHMQHNTDAQRMATPRRQRRLGGDWSPAWVKRRATDTTSGPLIAPSERRPAWRVSEVGAVKAPDTGRGVVTNGDTPVRQACAAPAAKIADSARRGTGDVDAATRRGRGEAHRLPSNDVRGGGDAQRGPMGSTRCPHASGWAGRTATGSGVHLRAAGAGISSGRSVRGVVTSERRAPLVLSKGCGACCTGAEPPVFSPTSVAAGRHSDAGARRPDSEAERRRCSATSSPWPKCSGDSLLGDQR
mmetsp:Transcript_29032/g.81066  ORF Transcript_29032/g.81066 Transcript_29032/m.81066 type:complete len:245 (+) Transcript_29032:42-776(+)